jgi:hypothetical protein
VPCALANSARRRHFTGTTGRATLGWSVLQVEELDPGPDIRERVDVLQGLPRHDRPAGFQRAEPVDPVGVGGFVGGDKLDRRAAGEGEGK